MADDNSIRSGPGNGRAVGQNRDNRGPSRNDGPGNSRSTSGPSLGQQIRQRVTEGLNNVFNARDSLDSNNEMMRGWERMRGNENSQGERGRSPDSLPPGQTKKQEQPANRADQARAEAQQRGDEARAEGQRRGDEARAEGQRRGDEARAEGQRRGDEARAEAQRRADEARTEGQRRGDEARTRADEARRPDDQGTRRSEENRGPARSEGPKKPEEAKRPEPPRPPEPPREHEPPGQARKQTESLMDRMREALEARKAERDGAPREAKRPEPPKTPEPPREQRPTVVVVRKEAPAQPQRPPTEAPQPRAPEKPVVLPQVAKKPDPPPPVKAPETPVVVVKRPDPPAPTPARPAATETTQPRPTPAPKAPERVQAVAQQQPPTPPRVTEQARIARVEVAAAPAPTAAIKTDRAPIEMRAPEEPTTHTAVVSRGSAEGAEHHTGGDADAQAHARQAEVRPIVRENRLLTRFLLPGRGDLEEELEALRTGPRVEKLGQRQQGKGGGGGQQGGGQGSGQGSGGGGQAQGEAGAEIVIDPHTGLPRTLIRPALMPLVPQLEQLFGQIGLPYTPETEETPQFMRSFWIALAWLSHHEQQGLSERMVYFGAAMFDGMQGWRRKLQQGEESTVNRLLAMLAEEGGFLGEHSLRVMTLADAVCDDMKAIDPELREQVRSGALLRDLGMAGLNYDKLPPLLASQAQELRSSGDLHMAGRLADIGALRVPEEIRNKPGPLDDRERAIMEKHPEYGEQFLQRFPPFRHLGPIVRAHHERWDGRGYPDGLMGRRIPLASRIIAVSDVWDALTSPRPWRDAWDYNSAYRYIQDKAGTQFDPDVAKAFLKSVRRLKSEGYLE